MGAAVAVLFARSDSYYKSLDAADVWDIDRDARKWPGMWRKEISKAEREHTPPELARWLVELAARCAK